MKSDFFPKITSHILISVRLEIKHDPDMNVEKIVNELDYKFKSTIRGSKVIDSCIEDIESISN